MCAAPGGGISTRSRRTARISTAINPRWKTASYGGETLVLGMRTIESVEGLNEIHRLDVGEGRIVRIRCYCFSPETLAEVAREFGIAALPCLYRSPSAKDVLRAVVGIRRKRS